jgi:hypothetical protein
MEEEEDKCHPSGWREGRQSIEGHDGKSCYEINLHSVILTRK